MKRIDRRQKSRDSPLGSNTVPGAPPLIIRGYETRDEGACRALVAELQDAERALDPRLRPGDSIADEYLAQMLRHCSQYAGALLVADHGGRVVGLALVLAKVPFESLDEPPGSYALVAELVVHRDFRRRGFANALLAAAETCARDAGATELRIGVSSANLAARQLYLRDGFAPYRETLAKPLAGVARRIRTRRAV